MKKNNILLSGATGVGKTFITELIAKKLGVPFITTDARDLLLKHNWPGNVRELENTLQRALVLSGGKAIDQMSIMIDKSLSNINENLSVETLADQLAFAKATW